MDCKCKSCKVPREVIYSNEDDNLITPITRVRKKPKKMGNSTKKDDAGNNISIDEEFVIKYEAMITAKFGVCGIVSSTAMLREVMVSLQLLVTSQEKKQQNHGQQFLYLHTAQQTRVPSL
jgi:hypothetical protein